jgi:Major tropism determinant N-terminal domain
MAIQIQYRNDTAANWTSANPILLSGEIGYETNTKLMKIGDGTTAWVSLAYFPSSASITSGAISGVTINNSVIGGTTPAAGTFTTLNSTTGAVNATVGATTPTTGAFTKITTSAGTLTVQPILMNAGTNLTTPVAGSVEYDGVVGYMTPTANTRGVWMTEQFILQTANYTLTSTTAAQQIFNATTNGAVTLPLGTFEFECQFNLSSMSATSGSFGFAIGGTATLGAQYWVANATKTAFATASNPQVTYNVAANTSIATATTTTTGFATIIGYITVAGAGTIVPQVSLTVAAAALVGPGSFFRIRPLGTNSVTRVGNWS